MTPVLSWEKPKRVKTVEAWKNDYQADGAPPGVYACSYEFDDGVPEGPTIIFDGPCEACWELSTATSAATSPGLHRPRPTRARSSRRKCDRARSMKRAALA